MSLINDLGGYEKASKILRSIGHEHDDALLEYRREHNIFEVGDLVVLPYKNYRKDVFILDSESERIFNLKGIVFRHATHAEIEAGAGYEKQGI